MVDGKAGRTVFLYFSLVLVFSRNPFKTDILYLAKRKKIRVPFVLSCVRGQLGAETALNIRSIWPPRIFARKLAASYYRFVGCTLRSNLLDFPFPFLRTHRTIDESSLSLSPSLTFQTLSSSRIFCRSTTRERRHGRRVNDSDDTIYFDLTNFQLLKRD